MTYSKVSNKSQDKDVKYISKDYNSYKNKLIEFFYDPVIVDGKHKRSTGKTSQVKLYKLKPEFAKGDQAAIDKAREAAGITPRGELNKYDRGIGQFLKGLAFFQGQQVALSAAQRNLTEQAAEKQAIADITAAQSKYAFSAEGKNEVDNIANLRYEFFLSTFPLIL